MHRVILAFLFLPLLLCAQPKTDSLLVKILSTNTNPVFKEIVAHPETYRIQIIYTQIDRDNTNKPSFHPYYFHYDSLLYFNPASMVKLPLAALSLEKLHEFKGINKYTTLAFDSSKPWQKPFFKDTSAANGLPTIAHFIKRALLISENDPYNRMYQFLGQQRINRRLHEMGYADARITRMFSGLTPEQNRYTNPIRFLDAMGKTRYVQPPAFNTDSFDFSRTILLGKAHFNRNDSLINQPFDFTKHNNLSLASMQQVLQAILFPKSVPINKRFHVTKDDYHFFYQYLSQYPSETPDPKYDTTTFYDSYAKFFFRDSTHRMPSYVRVFNKVGWSYGFLTDVSYVVDFKNKIEFMLAATLYVNSDEVLNDGKYEYTKTGWPFLYQLGQTIYQHELDRKRRHKPDLSAFKIRYEKRDKNDNRPSLVEVDN